MKPILVHYCQHSMGMGHLVRSLAIADALAADFDVTFLNGGRWPAAIRRPSAVRVIDLPPLGMQEDGALVSQDVGFDVAAALCARQQLIGELVRAQTPAAIVVEMYPFGRKKFRGEIETLLEGAPQAVTCCSVRDILVSARHDQLRHDNRAAEILNARFSCVIVHADAAFARLEETFKPQLPLRTPVYYSGFVAPAAPCAVTTATRSGVLVSAGGGAEGATLLQLALAAQHILHRQDGAAMTIVAGPFLPENEWLNLQRQARVIPGVTLLRSTPSLQGLMGKAAVSVSQCGYNTAMDIVRTRTPAVMVPFVRSRETEQLERARRLESLGLVQCMHPDQASPERLARHIEALRSAKPVDGFALNLDGATETARLLWWLLCERDAGRRVGAHS